MTDRLQLFRIFSTFLLLTSVLFASEKSEASKYVRSSFPWATSAERPVVASSLPADGAVGVSIYEGISTDRLVLPDGIDIDRSTINNRTVLLYQLGEDDQLVSLVPGRVGDTGGGDGIRLDPFNPLQPETRYQFIITDQVKLTDGTPFVSYAATFTTGTSESVGPTVLSDVAFTTQPAVVDDPSGNDYFTSLVIGPDGKLYASTVAGQIKRWVIQPDGSLSQGEVLSPPLTSSRLDGSAGQPEPRTIVGLTFAPEATADDPVVYVSHSKLIDFEQYSDDSLNWDGKISRLSGNQLEAVTDVVIHLPRSIKDHLTNCLVFDPGNPEVMYINQGGNSGGGVRDGIWRKQERLLSAAVLRLDLRRLPTLLPLDARTTDNIEVINNAPVDQPIMSDGTYNPYADQAPLTIYASGIRNAYDLVWHSNGVLYVPANGTGGASRTPTSDYFVGRDPSGRGVRRITGDFYNYATFPAVPGTEDNETQKDWLFKVVEHGYYGHPNPWRGEFVMNHGGQTYQGLAGQTAPHVDVQNYPATVYPDPNYREPVYDFGFNKSPNGVIEYRSNAFGGVLRGLLLITRFSNGNDLLLLKPGPDGGIERAYAAPPGLDNFDDPLDVVEDPRTGNLYVSEYDRNGGQPQLTLARVAPGREAVPAPQFEADATELIFESVPGESDQATVTVTNRGTEELAMREVEVIDNPEGYFSVLPAETTLPPGGQQPYTVTFDPPTAAEYGSITAQLIFRHTDATTADTLSLRALHKAGRGGALEPTLQDVVSTLGMQIDVGWNALATGTDPTLRGQEIDEPLLVRASNNPVRIEPLARYSPAEILPFGWYDSTGRYQRVGLLSADEAEAQTLFPALDSGGYEFNPRQEAFGIYIYSRTFDRYNHTEDERNDEVPHRSRIYPVRDRQGQLVENTYLVTFEEADNGDYQDYVFRISNVRPATEAILVNGPRLEVENMTKLPGTRRGFPADTLLVFHQVLNRINPAEQNTLQVHDQNTLRLRNDGTEPLTVTTIDIPDTGEFNYEFATADQRLPYSLAPGESTDLIVRFVKDQGFKEVIRQTMRIFSDAQPEPVSVTLSGAYMERADNRNEIGAEQVVTALGLTTQLTDSFPISGAFPTAEAVAAGQHGDLIYTPGFVQATPNQPVSLVQVAALHSYDNNNGTYSRLVRASNYQEEIPGSLFRHDGNYHQTLLPRLEGDESQLAGVSLTSVRDTFQVGVGPYFTGGGASLTRRKNELLGARTYRAVDPQGNVIPNTYLIVQDYIRATGDGCGSASSSNNCDFNDNIVYITNVRPAEVPTATLIPDTTASVDTPFAYELSPFFDPGYLGNTLSYALDTSAAPLPTWLSLDATSGQLSGTPDRRAPVSLPLTIVATDPNGISVRGGFTLTTEGGTSLPTVTSGGNQVSVWGDTLIERSVLTVEETNEYLVYQASGLPTGLTLDSLTGTVSGVVAAEVGDYSVTASVVLGSEREEVQWVWTVLAADSTVTGLSEAEEDPAVTLYPNPNDGVLWIELPEGEPAEEVLITITDPRGRRCLTTSRRLSTDRPLSITVGDLPPALYTVSVIRNQVVTVHKLLKR